MRSPFKISAKNLGLLTLADQCPRCYCKGGATTTIDFSAKVGAMLGGGVLGLFLLGLLWRRVSAVAAAVATALGVLVITWMSLSRWPIWPEALMAYRCPWHELTAGLVGTAVIVATGLLVALLSRSRNHIAGSTAPAPQDALGTHLYDANDAA